jgi:hypothetical protein
MMPGSQNGPELSGLIQSPRYRPKYGRSYPVWRFAGLYLLCLLVCLLSLPVLPLSWLCCGVFLSRYVSRRVRLSPLTGTVANVARAKWRLVLLWPVQMPRLISDILVIRYF